MDRREALKRSGLLAGVGFSAAALGGLLHSCQGVDRVDWQPVFFDPGEAKIVSIIVDHLLPRTDTPGAIDLQVDVFVDLMMAKSLSESDQAHVKKGVREFGKYCEDQYSRGFAELEHEEQVEAIRALGEQSNGFNVAVWGSPIGEQLPVDFYRRVRQFALIGYFTSEDVGKNILVYDPIPGSYRGCIPLDEIGNSWTL